MKTLVDFKRKLTKGSKWHVYYNLIKMDMGIRSVYRVRARSVSFLRAKDLLSTSETWFTFPKAKNMKFVDDNTVEVYKDAVLVLTYKFIEAGE